jgi:hypothetical protein
MKPRERCETGEQGLFRSRRDQIIDMKHALVKRAHTIDQAFLQGRFGAVYVDRPGQPPLPTRLMAGLAIWVASSGDVTRKIDGNPWLEEVFAYLLSLAGRTTRSCFCCTGDSQNDITRFCVSLAGRRDHQGETSSPIQETSPIKLGLSRCY